ncbi:MAG: hypothetical protein KA739_10715, partial [Pseudomonadales bacterium]|nr:hypothetical protein [Pseudomonadales bacterium]
MLVAVLTPPHLPANPPRTVLVCAGDTPEHPFRWTGDPRRTGLAGLLESLSGGQHDCGNAAILLRAFARIIGRYRFGIANDLGRAVCRTLSGRPFIQIGNLLPDRPFDLILAGRQHVDRLRIAHVDKA